MGAWDYIMVENYGVKTFWVWLFVPFELVLMINMCCRSPYRNAVRRGCFEWIVYSWLLSAKVCILYYRVLPELQDEFDADITDSAPVGVQGEDKCKEFAFMPKCKSNITTLLYITPLFYMILALRTLQELFPAGEVSEQESSGGFRRRSDAKGGRKECAALDVVLLTDMVWHVVIDMIDIIHMVKLPDSQDPADQTTMGVLNKHPEARESIQTMIGIFVCLAFFFHQQSFPRAAYRTSFGEVAGHDKLREKQLHGHHDYDVDVVKARKRSAIVSILLVDLPFLVVRTYVLFLSRPGGLWPTPNTTNVESLQYGFLHARPQVDKWWIKNVLCMLLQAMQLRFVQLADMERSQVLKWWDVRRIGSNSRWKGMKQDKELKKHWQKLDHNEAEDRAEDKKEAAFRDSGVDPSDPPPQEENLCARGDSSPVSSTGAVPGSAGDAHESRLRTSCSCCCCGRRVINQQKETRSCRSRCCCGCCGQVLFTHVIMGAVLGWLVAKVDFEQNINELYVIVGRST